MAFSFPTHRIRLQCDVRVPGTLVDRLTNEPIRIPRGSPVRIEVGLFANLLSEAPTSAAQVLDPVSESYLTLTLNVQRVLGTNLISKSTSTFALPTYATWNDDTAQHASITLTAQETNLDKPGIYHLALTATRTGTSGDILIGSGSVEVYETFMLNAVNPAATLSGNFVPHSLLTTTGDVPYASAANTWARRAIGTEGYVYTVVSGVPNWAPPSGVGDVVGPASATDNAIARFDGTTGKLVQNSAVTVGDDGTVTATAFSGSGAGLTGIVTTAGNNTFTGTNTFNNDVTVGAGGLLTATNTFFQGNLVIGGGGTVTVGGASYQALAPSLLQAAPPPPMAGTVEVDGGALDTVIGTGTAFTSLAPGDFVSIAGTVAEVDSITSDTEMVLAAALPSAVAAETSAFVVSPYRISVDADNFARIYGLSTNINATFGINMVSDTIVGVATSGFTLQGDIQHGAGNITTAGTLSSGFNGATGGSLTLHGSESGSATISVSATGGLQLPAIDGTMTADAFSGDGSALTGLPAPALTPVTFADASAVAAATPSADGQIAIQLDNNRLYLAGGTVPGGFSTPNLNLIGLTLGEEGEDGAGIRFYGNTGGHASLRAAASASNGVLSFDAGTNSFSFTNGTASLTIPAGSASTITGGGTLALGGYTLTVPSTGTAVTTTTINNGTLPASFTTVAASGTLSANTIALASGTTATLFNTAATTVNAFGAGTTISIGAATGATTINNNLNLPASTATNGQIQLNGARFMFTAGTESLFLGLNCGNPTFASFSGARCFGLGVYSLSNVTSASDVVGLGRGTLYTLSTASNLTAVGTSALSYSNANYMVGIGGYAGYNSTGTQGTFLGAAAGLTVTSGTHATFIGSYCDGVAGAHNYQMAIGAGATVTGTGNYQQCIGAGSTVSTANTFVIGRAADMVTLPGALRDVPVAQTATTAAVSVTVTTTALTTTAPAQAITLADGTNGQLKRIAHVASSGGGTAILTPTTKTGYATITFAAVGDTVTLQFFTTVGWLVMGSRGVAIA